MKFNPKLPPMSKFIRDHMHILQLTAESNNLFNKDSIFVAYKMERNILSLITRNKFKSSNFDHNAQPSSELMNSNELLESNWGCYKCSQNCTLCKNFLIETKTFTSPNTNQTFKIKTKTDCKTKNIIYLILDLICYKNFYVGYSEDSMTVRWPNHKSHIKKGHKLCEISTHFINESNNMHKLDTSSQKVFTSQLSKQISIIIIESVAPIDGIDMKSLLQERENFWQGTLKSTQFYGGINKRTNKL